MPPISPQAIQQPSLNLIRKAVDNLCTLLEEAIPRAEGKCYYHPDSKFSISQRNPFSRTGKELAVDPQGLYDWLKNIKTKLDKNEPLTEKTQGALKMLAFEIKSVIENKSLNYPLQDIKKQAFEIIGQLRLRVDKSHRRLFSEKNIHLNTTLNYIISATAKILQERAQEKPQNTPIPTERTPAIAPEKFFQPELFTTPQGPQRG